MISKTKSQDRKEKGCLPLLQILVTLLLVFSGLIHDATLKKECLKVFESAITNAIAVGTSYSLKPKRAFGPLRCVRYGRVEPAFA